ncbi:hypothetical protein NQ318_023597 [Aromia moschata]|uniref:Uncharacterized protein n=1 Tax=Aromia moschata TaxID=1265417 RepID=A0AAV8YS25_9CUCU|nr:hypothetical protein NQ318_023597 [Aromia moschata]
MHRACAKTHGNETSHSEKKMKGGKLTGKLIDELTVYYGLAIRRHSNSLTEIKNAVWATLYHKCSTDDEPRHEYCPQGPESWCSWQQGKAAGTLDEYEHDKPLHDDVIAAFALCVGGFTQNANEIFNNNIWRIAPKSHNGGAVITNITANIAACVFNEGASSYMQIMHELGIKIGRDCRTICETQDEARIDIAEIRALDATREGRINRRRG